MINRHVYSKQLSFTKEQFFQAYEVLSQEKDHHVILESGRNGNYSICGLQPFAILEGYADYLQVTDRLGQVEKLDGNPLHRMKEWMHRYSIPSGDQLPDFRGGAIGFISYDYVRCIEKLPILAKDDLETPYIYFLVFDEVAVFEHKNNILWLLKVGEQETERACLRRLDEIEQDFIRAASSHTMRQQSNSVYYSEESLSVSMTEQEFITAVEKIKKYISFGDIFQVNLSVRQSKPLTAHPQAIYSALRELNPSPYMGYIQTPSFQIVSGSPELLVKKKRNHVSTRPIAGTRSRGKDAEEDERLEQELMNNEKERAEHVMLVDLERNDLGKVCEYGSVEVNEFMTIEKYSHVMHIVSNVQGTLETSFDGYDLIDAAFPGGTITGAPKIRTMEIIEELEPVRRGIYTGSIGWIGFDGDLELNIVIRTLFAKGGIGHIQAGAGVVIDSVPENEYKESLKKAKAIWRAKEMADEKVEGKQL
ncbi:anthranilate synthase component I family protein [Bacillus sp. AGMB 02131]|uniref:Anthranilate synthase component I family protein n=1 Tax=Peribacillus faecalis TaxID=2772559 RepID=A0A927D041_9BACI|nr:anthranilate synthase component I family protein [Peribacillus faecalis]MBD3108990.1 anthranilate synthase component I family protein [Peribacillus faecalis]